MTFYGGGYTDVDTTSTVGSVIKRVLRTYLLTGQREIRNRLASTLTDTQETVTFDFDLQSVTPGVRLAVGLEEMHVWSVVGTSRTATVERGTDGSPASEHPQGEIVWVAPRFSPYDVFLAINDELRGLSSPVNGLYQRKTADISLLSNVRAYDLPTDLVDIIGVYYTTDSYSEVWYQLGRKDWSFTSGLPTTEFASGMALGIPYLSPHHDVRVVYKAAFDIVNALDDELTDTGLPATATDIVEVGAALRLAAGRPIRRAFTEGQSDTRRADEVSTSDVLRAPAAAQQLYRQRIAEEAARLKQQNGV